MFLVPLLPESTFMAAGSSPGMPGTTNGSIPPTAETLALPLSLCKTMNVKSKVCGSERGFGFFQ